MRFFYGSGGRSCVKALLPVDNADLWVPSKFWQKVAPAFMPGVAFKEEFIGFSQTKLLIRLG